MSHRSTSPDRTPPAAPWGLAHPRSGGPARHNAVAGWITLPDAEVADAIVVADDGAHAPLAVTPDDATLRFRGFVPWRPGPRREITFDVVLRTADGGTIRLGPFPLHADDVFVAVATDDPLGLVCDGVVRASVSSRHPLATAPRLAGGRRRRSAPWRRVDDAHGHTWETTWPLGADPEPPTITLRTQDQSAAIALPFEPAPLLRAAAASLGHPGTVPPPEPATTAPRPSPHAAPMPRAATCAVTVCTRTHLHHAVVLAQSLATHHPGMPLVVIVPDADDAEPDVVGADAHVVPARALGVTDFPSLALRYSAADLCCALKPAAVRHTATRTGAERVVYIDADVRLYAPMDALLRALDDADVVATPHVLAPLPNPDRPWEQPQLGALAWAGVLNAGLFGMRTTAATAAFLAQWERLVTGPGAFDRTLGGQSEQNAFNWVVAFVDRVRVLRDPAYNVAYWNLHDRALRWSGLDDGDDAFTVDGRPLVAFHFSGFSPFEPATLSRHQTRYDLHVLPSVARLCAAYADELLDAGAARHAARPWRFGRFPSGIAIDDRLRDLVKTHADTLDPDGDLDPWTPAGEARCWRALLAPIPHQGLLPAVLDAVYRTRGDLQLRFPDADLQPAGFLRWAGLYGAAEHGLTDALARHRPTAPTPGLLRALRAHGACLADLDAPLGDDRATLVARLRRDGAADLATAVEGFDGERWLLAPLQTVRDLWEEREDLQRTYPDPLFADADGFARWFETHGAAETGVPASLGRQLRHVAQGRCLARIFSLVNRVPSLAEAFPLGLVGVDRDGFARTLLSCLRSEVEFGLDDVLAWRWVMDTQPWRGVTLTCELTVNQRRPLSSRLPEGQEALLRPLLGDARVAEALRAHQARWDTDAESRREAAWIRATTTPAAPTARTAAPHPSREDGVNLFGFFLSPVGLGTMTRGLALALRRVGVPVAENVVGNVALAADVRPEHFVRRWNWRYPTNVFVSYPHLRERLLEGVPDHVGRGRRNVAYLAWEQRDAVAGWRGMYEDLSDVWALSTFAADSLARVLARPVLDVPCVLDVDGFPPAASKAALGLPDDATVFLYVFDPNSSIERKNPEAAIAAFAAAFGARRDVLLLMKVSHPGHGVHRARLAALRALAERSGAHVRFVFGKLPTADVLRLISAVDCYVSLHRAEGFGYTCAEAMHYARPVIATGYSGNLDFMTPENSWLVRATEIPVLVGDGPFQRGSVWAEPDVEHAAALMRHVAAHPDEARAVGLRGRVTVHERLTPEAVGVRVAAALGLTVRDDAPARATAAVALPR